MDVLDKYLGEASLEDIQKADMDRFLRDAIEQYNDLMVRMVAINIRDGDIKKEWKKVDKIFDKIMSIANKKGYFKK